jgi:hypothetical protein
LRSSPLTSGRLAGWLAGVSLRLSLVVVTAEAVRLGLSRWPTPAPAPAYVRKPSISSKAHSKAPVRVCVRSKAVAPLRLTSPRSLARLRLQRRRRLHLTPERLLLDPRSRSVLSFGFFRLSACEKNVPVPALLPGFQPESSPSPPTYQSAGLG